MASPLQLPLLETLSQWFPKGKGKAFGKRFKATTENKS
jgi:hypothetical protein